MRFLSAILICLGAASLTPCLADPPASTAAAASQPATNAASTPAAAPAQAAPATSQPAAPAAKVASATASPAAKATPTLDADEKQLMDAGYSPEMHNGTKLWCHREQEIGSRLGSRQKVCGTAAEITLRQRQTREQFQQEMPGTYGTAPSTAPGK